MLREERCVALVEDDPIMGESLVQRLALDGIAVQWWRNGRDALAAIETCHFRAVVCDIRRLAIPREMPMTEHAQGGHDHAGHGHSHAPTSFGRAFAIGVALNTGFVIVEGIYGFLGNSTALVADAGHNLGDVFGLLVAWGASILARRAPTTKYTYGLKGGSILAALFNAMFLLITVGAIAWESVQRFWAPEAVAGKTVMIVAAIGILVNGVTAWLFASGRKGDLNIRGAFLHMASDAIVSAGVVAAGAVILVTGWVLLDPLVSLAICGVIVWGTWSLLGDSVRMALAAVPDNVEADRVRKAIEEMPGVSAPKPCSSLAASSVAKRLNERSRNDP